MKKLITLFVLLIVGNFTQTMQQGEQLFKLPSAKIIKKRLIQNSHGDLVEFELHRSLGGQQHTLKSFEMALNREFIRYQHSITRKPFFEPEHAFAIKRILLQDYPYLIQMIQDNLPNHTLVKRRVLYEKRHEEVSSE